jgi:hypothetical protein
MQGAPSVESKALQVMHEPTESRRSIVGVLLASMLGCAAPPGNDAEAPDVRLLHLQGATIELQFAPGLDAEVRTHAQAWVQRCAAAVAAYFGRFPLPRVELLVIPANGDGVLSGTSFAEPEPLVRLRIGRTTTAAQFESDWILVHEMVHLAVPRVPTAQQWLHEGIATYVEALARGHAHLIGADQVWFGWLQQMPRGLPQVGESGLDNTPTWARTYWGGALFCLLADVRSRQRGAPGRGLQQALQGVLRAGGDYRVAWPVTRILGVADATLGLTTFAELYEEMKERAVSPDLAALWHDLGVTAQGQREDAPLAHIRRAILS